MVHHLPIYDCISISIDFKHPITNLFSYRQTTMNSIYKIFFCFIVIICYNFKQNQYPEEVNSTEILLISKEQL